MQSLIKLPPFEKGKTLPTFQTIMAYRNSSDKLEFCWVDAPDLECSAYQSVFEIVSKIDYILKNVLIRLKSKI